MERKRTGKYEWKRGEGNEEREREQKETWAKITKE